MHALTARKRDEGRTKTKCRDTPWGSCCVQQAMCRRQQVYVTAELHKSADRVASSSGHNKERPSKTRTSLLIKLPQNLANYLADALQRFQVVLRLVILAL